MACADGSSEAALRQHQIEEGGLACTDTKRLMQHDISQLGRIPSTQGTVFDRLERVLLQMAKKLIADGARGEGDRTTPGKCAKQASESQH
jgi:hypothetical protein